DARSVPLTAARGGGPDARELLGAADAGRQLGLVRDQDRKPLLDGELCVAAGADEQLLLAGECGLAGGVARAAELSEAGLVHVRTWWSVEMQKPPPDCSGGGFVSLQAGGRCWCQSVVG